MATQSAQFNPFLSRPQPAASLTKDQELRRVAAVVDAMLQRTGRDGLQATYMAIRQAIYANPAITRDEFVAFVGPAAWAKLAMFAVLSKTVINFVARANGQADVVVDDVPEATITLPQG